MNSANLIGRLTKDPETRYTGEGLAITAYTLAVDRRGGEADFIPVKAFGKSAEFADKYFHKGMKVAVTGRIQTGSYTNKEGRKVYTFEVAADNQEFCERKEQADNFMDVPDGADVPFA